MKWKQQQEWTIQKYKSKKDKQDYITLRDANIVRRKLVQGNIGSQEI